MIRQERGSESQRTGRGIMRNLVKTSLGTALRVAPQARYSRTILLFSHMRGATTALSNVLCTHPQISGYGETHVPHGKFSSPGRLLLNLYKRSAFKYSSHFLFDKVLHNTLDREFIPETARCIFLVRAPTETLPSITTLAKRTGLTDLTTTKNAGEYYCGRLARLHGVWTSCPPHLRIGLKTEDLLSQPEAVLNRISDWLNLATPLSNSYVSHAASRQHGAGDPTLSAKHNQILRRAPRKPAGTASKNVNECDTLYHLLSSAFSEANGGCNIRAG
jgi:hypothetical protein